MGDDAIRRERRKYVYGKDRDQTHDKWLKLHAAAKAGPVVTKSQTVGEYLAYWLKDVVTEPDYAPLTVTTYRGHARLYLVPGLGKYKLDQLSVRNTAPGVFVFCDGVRLVSALGVSVEGEG